MYAKTVPWQGKKYTIVFSIIFVNAKTVLGQAQKIYNCLLNKVYKK
jgi:hypothetical protein